ncbi:MAG: type IV pili methyl-accepting chemotaxis transducer N-terminal domain-containing protein, partial [Cyanobacteria bacterium P01_F01_bin.4]
MKITTQLKLTIAGLACFAVGTTALASFNAQKGALDGSVVNKSGIVRGATQRLVKLETNGQTSDELIQKLDRLVNGLINGDQALRLPKATDPEYLAKIQAVESAWQQLKITIAQYRQNPSFKSKLIADSEAYFELTDEAVFSAERVSTAHVEQIKITQGAILLLNLGVLASVFWTIQRATKLLKQSVVTVSGSSSQIAATVEAQERLVADQTASVTVTTSTIEELGSASLQAAQKANSSASGAREALDLSETGAQAVDHTVQGIEELRDKVRAIADQ